MLRGVPRHIRPTTAPSSSPKPCRTGSQPSAQARPTSHAAARGRTASSRASMRACVTSFSMGRSSTRSARRRSHRKLAPPLQWRPAACLHRLSGSRPGGVRARTRRMAGCATPTSSAGHAPTGATTSPKLTSQPDHPTGADHLVQLAEARRRAACQRDAGSADLLKTTANRHGALVLPNYPALRLQKLSQGAHGNACLLHLSNSSPRNSCNTSRYPSKRAGPPGARWSDKAFDRQFDCCASPPKGSLQTWGL